LSLQRESGRSRPALEVQLLLKLPFSASKKKRSGKRKGRRRRKRKRHLMLSRKDRNYSRRSKNRSSQEFNLPILGRCSLLTTMR